MRTKQRMPNKRANCRKQDRRQGGNQVDMRLLHIIQEYCKRCTITQPIPIQIARTTHISCIDYQGRPTRRPLHAQSDCADRRKDTRTSPRCWASVSNLSTGLPKMPCMIIRYFRIVSEPDIYVHIGCIWCGRKQLEKRNLYVLSLRGVENLYHEVFQLSILLLAWHSYPIFLDLL